MKATKQTKMTKEDLHLSWKDKLNIIRDNRYFLMLFPIVMLAVMILIFGVATAGRFFKLSVMKGILSQAIIIGTCATGVAFIYLQRQPGYLHRCGAWPCRHTGR